MADEGSREHHGSLAAPLIFIVVMAFQYASWWLEKLKKNASKTERAMQLHAEIKQLLKQAGTLSQPSTFAQAAKLRRQAAAKEKELANYQDLRGKEVKLSYDLYLKVLFSSKVFAYLVLVFWFWRAPVAIISQQLVQPLGGLLSWWSGGVQNNTVMVGIIPWLIVSSRVCKFICRLLK